MAQEQPAPDSLEREILAHPVADVVLLGKTRAVLLESFKAADAAKARRVVQYMETRFDRTKMVVLHPSEELIVAYWLNDFQKVLLFARAADSIREQPKGTVIPMEDLFYDEMIELSRRGESGLRANIRNSSLAPHERDYALLLLSDMLGQERGDQLQREAFQRRLNEEADAYLAAYPDSEYNPFIRRYIRFVMVASDWGHGYGVSLGYLGLPNALNRHLGDYVLFSFNYEVAYRQAYMYLGMDFGLAHKISKGFEYDGTWEDGMSVMHTSGILAFGPMVTLGEGFLAIPTLGISYMDFSQPDKEKEQTGEDVSMGFAAWALGVNFRIPLGGEEGSSFITINAGYRQAITNINLARGGYTFLNVGFGMFARPEERDF